MFERSADASIVEITLLTGRNDDRKRSLYRAIAAGAVAAGFRSDDVMVALIENGPIDWSLGRGEAYDKHGSAAPGCLTPSPAAAARGSTAPP